MGIANRLGEMVYNFVTVPKSGLKTFESGTKTHPAGLKSGLKTVPKSGLKSPNTPVLSQNSTFSGIESVYSRQRRIMQAALIKKRMGAGIISRERGARHVQYALKLADPFELDTLIKSGFAESLSLGSGSHHVIVRRDHGIVIVEFALKDTYWQFYDRSNVSGLGIGLATEAKQVDFEFNHNISNALFGGTINSGKSVAVSSAMLAMMSNYTPDKLKFIVIDPHNDYDDFTGCSHLIAPVANTNSQIIDSLMTAKKVLDHRRRNNIKDDYRLTVTIDEINEVSTIEADTEAGAFDAYDAIKDLANARKYNIGVIAAGQELTKDNLPGKDKYPNRFIGKVLKENSAFATGLKGLQADKLLGEGDFYHVKFGEATRFQVAQPKQMDFDRLDRGEATNLDYELSTSLIEEPLIDDNAIGRPKAKVEPDILADFMAANLSKRKAQELGYGQTTWKLHKMFLDKLRKTLEAKGFSLEIRGI